MERTSEEESSRGFVLPFYNYLGPGNSGNTGYPVNELDQAAKRHDDEYDRIKEEFDITKDYNKFEENIRKADEEFINKVHSFAPEGAYDTVAKWLALGGIETKMVVEKYTGILYPNVSVDNEDTNNTMEGISTWRPRSHSPKLKHRNNNFHAQFARFHDKKIKRKF